MQISFHTLSDTLQKGPLRFDKKKTDTDNMALQRHSSGVTDWFLLKIQNEGYVSLAASKIGF